MKAALLSKVALCVCPPALVATAVATVPPVKKAVHHATRPHNQAKSAAPRTTASTPAAKRTLPPCGSPGLVTDPVQQLTYAAPVPAEPTALQSLGGPAANVRNGGVASNGSYVPLVSGVFPGAGGGGGGAGGTDPGGTVPPGATDPSVVTPVPEPASWLLMITGFGILGATLRRRRHAKATGRAAPRHRRAKFAGLAAVAEALSPLEAAGTGSAVAANATKVGMLAKAALCVCPPALIAATAVTVPPVRNAVYQATAPAIALAPTSVLNADGLCDPSRTIVINDVRPVSEIGRSVQAKD